jgi:hypothetical protein
MFNNSNQSGWWYTYPSEKYDFVSWDDDIPKLFMFQTTNQYFIVGHFHGIH